jgi:hypothetical protein
LFVNRDWQLGAELLGDQGWASSLTVTDSAGRWPGFKTYLWRLVCLLRSSSATVLEDGVQVGLAVVESRLEVVHLFVQAFHVLLDGLLVSCQAHFDVGLWAGDKPRRGMSERVS